ncbi:MAG: PmoA family protein [Opitutae bacterium]|nr:PmoA family protein [Opitutae bacterium]
MLEYFPYGRPEAVVMADTVDLTIGMPREDGSYRIVWEQVSRARAPVVLDRTPLPGEPEGKSYGGYAGLSFRGDRFLDAVTVRTSTGRTDLDAQRLPAQWAALTGTVDGRPAGIALFDHPSNPRHPTPWYFVLKKSRGGAPHSPFWFVNAAFLNNQPFTLAPGQPLVRRHLVRVDNRPPDAAALEEEFRRFAATSAVPDTHQP